MEKRQIKSRLAIESDAALLFHWRNDPLTRKNSISEDPISWDAHIAWFGGVLSGENQGKALYVAEYEKAKIGTFRVDDRDGYKELSWTVSPVWRGQGVGSLMVEHAAKKIGGRLRAVIKKKNVASKRIAEKVGFKWVGDYGDLETWELDGGQKTPSPTP